MKTTPKDFFLHLFSTIILYTAVGSLIDLGFTIVNNVWPDALSNYYYAGSLIWPVSMLIVLTPLFYIFETLIGRDIAKMPEKKDIWIRRWRIYLTLFLTVATIAGDLIALINTYLNGEITTRFGLKVIIVFVISAVVFKYYYLCLKDSSAKVVLMRKILSWLGIILVLAGIVGGFVIVGSPAKQRAMRFDEQRIYDLENIQNELAAYYQRRNQYLPVALDDLNDQLTGYTPPNDPETHKAYIFNPITTDVFELCADFSRPSIKRDVYTPQYSDYIVAVADWSHTAGHYCFRRSIDPTKYPSKIP